MVGFLGNPSCPNEFYGPWDPYGQATLSQNPFKKKNLGKFLKIWKIAGGPCHLPVALPIPLGGKLFRGGACEQAGQPEQNRNGHMFD